MFLHILNFVIWETKGYLGKVLSHIVHLLLSSHAAAPSFRQLWGFGNVQNCEDVSTKEIDSLHLFEIE